MPSQIIQQYLDDESIPVEQRKSVFTDLGSGEYKESDIEAGLKKTAYKNLPATALALDVVSGAPEASRKAEADKGREEAKSQQVLDSEGLLSAPARGFEQGKQVDATKQDLRVGEATSGPGKFIERAAEVTSPKPVMGAVAETVENLFTGAIDKSMSSPQREFGEKLEEEKLRIKEEELAAMPEWQRKIAEEPGAIKKIYDSLPKEAKDVVGEAGFTTRFFASLVGAGEGAGLISKGAKAIAKTQSGKAVAKEAASISEAIAAPTTKKEAQLAISQGRLVKGKEGLLTGKKPDVVLPTEKLQETSVIIQKKIPNASKLNEPELYTALDVEIGNTAKTLKPEMKKALFTNNQKNIIKEKWADIKTKQASTPEFANSRAGAKQSQKQFQSFLDELDKPKGGQMPTLDDIWDLRKRYDATIPQTVKKATELSDSFLQLRKQMWLDNRELFNVAINDSVQGLGATSEQAFKEMNGMYEAKNNILQKAKIDVKGKKGILSKENLKKAAIGYGAAKLIEKTTGLNIPGI